MFRIRIPAINESILDLLPSAFPFFDRRVSGSPLQVWFEDLAEEPEYQGDAESYDKSGFGLSARKRIRF